MTAPQRKRPAPRVAALFDEALGWHRMSTPTSAELRTAVPAVRQALANTRQPVPPGYLAALARLLRSAP